MTGLPRAQTNKRIDFGLYRIDNHIYTTLFVASLPLSSIAIGPIGRLIGTLVGRLMCKLMAGYLAS